MGCSWDDVWSLWDNGEITNEELIRRAHIHFEGEDLEEVLEEIKLAIGEP